MPVLLPAFQHAWQSLASVLAQLQAGHKLGPYEVTVSPVDARAYVSAVGGPESPDYGGALPPIAVVAAGLSRLINELELGAGTVHAGQEAEFYRMIKPGEKILVYAELKSNSLRREVRIATIAADFRDSSGATVATAASTVIVPA